MNMTEKQRNAWFDRRKAKIVGCLRATRTHRGAKSEADATELAARLGVSLGVLQTWESGRSLPPDETVPILEAYLAEGPIWRQTAPDKVVGPDRWAPLAPRPSDNLAAEDATGGQPDLSVGAMLGEQIGAMHASEVNVWFRDRFGDGYRVKVDESGDPYIPLAPSRNTGFVYAHGAGTIALWINGTGRANNLEREFPALARVQHGDRESAFTWPADRGDTDRLLLRAGAVRRRHLSEAQKEASKRTLARFHFRKGHAAQAQGEISKAHSAVSGPFWAV